MKKLILTALLLLICSTAQAGISVCYDQDGKVVQHTLRGNPIPGCDYYDGGGNYDTVRNLLKTVQQKYLKKLNNDPVEMSSAEKVAVDDALATFLETQFRMSQKANFDGSQGVYLRALVKVLLDEINILRSQHSLTPRTLTQAKTAVQNAIDTKLVDE